MYECLENSIKVVPVSIAIRNVPPPANRANVEQLCFRPGESALLGQGGHIQRGPCKTFWKWFHLSHPVSLVSFGPLGIYRTTRRRVATQAAETNISLYQNHWRAGFYIVIYIYIILTTSTVEDCNFFVCVQIEQLALSRGIVFSLFLLSSFSSLFFWWVQVSSLGAAEIVDFNSDQPNLARPSIFPISAARETCGKLHILPFSRSSSSRKVCHLALI